MGTEIDGSVMGEDFKGYVFRITGGNDKQGFTMKQGIMINGRTRILFRRRGTLYKPRRTGERKRRSVRGCICGPDLAVISLRIAKKGEKEIEGVTDVNRPNRLFKKRKNKIAAAFALDSKKDDVTKYVARREIKRGDKTFYKSPNVQRLITEKRLRRKSVLQKAKKERYQLSKEAQEKYEKILSQYAKEKKAQKEAARKVAESK